MNLFICFFFESIMNKVCVPFVIARDLCPYGKTVVTSIVENMSELSKKARTQMKEKSVQKSEKADR